MDNKFKYRSLCIKEPTIPIYSQAFWLDACCGSENWDVLLYESGGEILAAWPYCISQKFFLRYIRKAKFTQFNGIWIRYPRNQKPDTRLSYEKKIMSNLIEQLEKIPIVLFMQCFSPAITNWLPFYWNGYRQSTSYSYIIPDIRDMDHVVASWSAKKRNNLRKAFKNELSLVYDIPPERFYALHKDMLKQQGKEITYTYNAFKRIYEAAYDNKSGCTLGISDQDGNIHSIIFLIWDQMMAYNLKFAHNPNFSNYEGGTLLFYEAIKYCSSFVNEFDFEGSMIESVENSYHQFGTVQTPYFNIKKVLTKNKLLSIALKMKFYF